MSVSYCSNNLFLFENLLFWILEHLHWYCMCHTISCIFPLIFFFSLSLHSGRILNFIGYSLFQFFFLLFWHFPLHAAALEIFDCLFIYFLKALLPRVHLFIICCIVCISLDLLIVLILPRHEQHVVFSFKFW